MAASSDKPMGRYQRAFTALQQHLVDLGALEFEPESRGLLTSAFLPAISKLKASGDAQKISSFAHQILAQRRALPDAKSVEGIDTKPGAEWDEGLDDIIANILARAAQELAT